MTDMYVLWCRYTYRTEFCSTVAIESNRGLVDLSEPLRLNNPEIIQIKSNNLSANISRVVFYIITWNVGTMG